LNRSVAPTTHVISLPVVTDEDCLVVNTSTVSTFPFATFSANNTHPADVSEVPPPVALVLRKYA